MADDEEAFGITSNLDAEAVAWFTRMNGKPSDADRRHFEEWLAADPARRRAYDDVRALWSSAEIPGADVAREEESSLANYLDDVRRMRKQKVRARVRNTAIICLCAAMAGSWLWLEKPNLLQDMQADYVTARGERRTIELQDGSTIILDVDTAIDVDMAANERGVRLLRGAAFFTVTPSDVPFVVRARDGEARVLGTTFDVAIRDENVLVTLESGSLQVTEATTSRNVTLAPGEGVTYSPAGIGQTEMIDASERLAWHDGRIVFTNARLGDVLHQLERYREWRILVPDGALADRRLSGSFAVDDTGAALAAIQSLVGFTINDIGGRLVVITP